MDFKYSPGKNSGQAGRGNTLLSAWKAVALLNLHFAATCIEHCHSNLWMTNGGLSSLNLSEVCEASASTASSPHGVHGWCGKPLLISFVALIFVFGGAASNSPNVWRFFGHNPECCPFPHWKKGPTSRTTAPSHPVAAQNSAHLLSWSSCSSVLTSGGQLSAIPPKTRPLPLSEMGRRMSVLLFHVRNREL